MAKPGVYSLRVRLVGIVFLAICPALILLFVTGKAWAGFAVAFLALVAAWVGGEQFVLRQVRVLVSAVRRLESGDLGARTGLAAEPGEIGQLAGCFDSMAGALEQRVKDREEQERRSLDRALQQTAVAALGQFALTHDDFNALLQQAASLAAQTLDVEFSQVLERLPSGDALLLRAGTGWGRGHLGLTTLSAQGQSPAAVTFRTGEPVLIRNWDKEKTFARDRIFEEHGIVSAMAVAVTAPRQRQAFGVLAVYSRVEREFDSDDLQFLLSVSNTLAAAEEQRQAEAELRKLADFARLNPNPALELRADGSVTYFNEAALKLARDLGLDQPSQLLDAATLNAVPECLASGRSVRLECKLHEHVLSCAFHPLVMASVVHAYINDITERLSLEAQLRQSQKLESIGQLAAGVAHDFNNMLTVIQGHAGMLSARTSLPPEVKESVQAVSYAAERAAGLTRQLLLFSRKSVMQPRLLDLREIIGNMITMLRRLLGENIALEYQKPPDLPLIEADPAMVEQVLMNLSVNARDAMPSGGRLSIDADVADFEVAPNGSHAEARAGRFVRLQVTDSGHGMNDETRARIFEPFFTTKGPGKGTGLGLATVYGIVKQHQGWIEVSSSPGQGTSFTVFFPATRREGTIDTTDAVARAIPRGNETILLVEDEPSVLAMGRIILQDCGYRTFEAESGVEALEIWRERMGEIDLLLTDMIMPQGLSGLELAEKLRAEKPELKVLFTSGYSVDQFDTDFTVRAAGAFLQKPYTRSTLSTAVRERLDA